MLHGSTSQYAQNPAHFLALVTGAEDSPSIIIAVCAREHKSIQRQDKPWGNVARLLDTSMCRSLQAVGQAQCLTVTE